MSDENSAKVIRVSQPFGRASLFFRVVIINGFSCANCRIDGS